MSKHNSSRPAKSIRNFKATVSDPLQRLKHKSPMGFSQQRSDQLIPKPKAPVNIHAGSGGRAGAMEEKPVQKPTHSGHNSNSNGVRHLKPAPVAGVPSNTNLEQVETAMEVLVYNGVPLSAGQIKTREHIHRILKRTQRPHWLCDSMAGSGKSFTIKYTAREIHKLYPRDKVLILQFNTHIADQTRADLAGLVNVEVKTNHSAGMAVLRLNGHKVFVDKNKFFSICKAIVEKNFNALTNNGKDAVFALDTQVQGEGKKKDSKGKKVMALTIQLLDCVEMAQQTLCDYDSVDALQSMINRHEMSIRNTLLLNHVAEAIEKGISIFEKIGEISFTEMLFLPVKLKMNFPKHDWILCDESQDFNAAQMEIVFNHMATGGRIGIWGDKRQSIMMWAGAMPDAIDKFIARTDARQIPLAVCYRCPSKVLDLARLIIPNIENRPNCPEGSVEVIPHWKIKDTAKLGDFILCRLTAPLVSLCIEFIRNNIRAKVKGRDIGAKLKTLYQQIVDSGGDTINTVNEFIAVLPDYLSAERISLAQKKASQSKIIQTEDSFAALKAIADYVSTKGRVNLEVKNSGGDSHTRIKDQITYIFDEAIPTDFITLCTVHRAKGLETDRVFIIDFHKIPFKPGVGMGGPVDNSPPEEMYSADDLRQEMNLMYVAITRAKEQLFIAGQGMDELEHVTDHIKNWVEVDRMLQEEGDHLETLTPESKPKTGVVYDADGPINPDAPIEKASKQMMKAFTRIEGSHIDDIDSGF